MGIEIVEHKISDMESYFSSRRISSVEEYHTFVKGRIESLLPNVSNCIGTGLFVSGEKDEDVFNWNYDGKNHEYLKDLRQASTPVKGMLVAWERNSLGEGKEYYSHLGIIIGIDPILVTNRDGIYGPIMHGEPLVEINKKYLHSDVKTKYLVPSMLEDLL